VNLLSVDFDFFFRKVERWEDGKTPDGRNTFFLYDWGHKESPFMIKALWPIRAVGFLDAGLPLPSTTGEEQMFWSRFRFKKGARFYYAESHSQIARPKLLRDILQIWSFDAHHDAGYKTDTLDRIHETERVSAEDWVVYAQALGIHVRVIYPRWRSYALEDEPPDADVDRLVDDGEKASRVVFDRVFVCRSGAWVPSWVDEQFFAFMDAAPFKKKQLIGIPIERREWETAVQQIRENNAKLKEFSREGEERQ